MKVYNTNNSEAGNVRLQSGALWKIYYKNGIRIILPQKCHISCNLFSSINGSPSCSSWFLKSQAALSASNTSPQVIKIPHPKLCPQLYLHTPLVFKAAKREGPGYLKHKLELWDEKHGKPCHFPGPVEVPCARLEIIARYRDPKTRGIIDLNCRVFCKRHSLDC